MRFPLFTADPIQPESQCCRGGHRERYSRMGRLSSPPFATAPCPTTSAFILNGGARYKEGLPEQKGEAHQHQEDPHHHHRRALGPQPGFCLRDCLSHSDLDDAFNLAKGLLGELLDQPGAEKTGENKRKQPAGRWPCLGHCSDKTSSTPCCGQSCSKVQKKSSPDTSKPPAQKLIHKEKKANPKAAEQKHEGMSEVKKTESSGPSLWSHSLYFPRFSPNKVSAKLRDGRVHILAAHEQGSGPSSCLSKVKVARIVELPENVDQKTLTCTMKLDGTLVLQAELQESPPLSTGEDAVGRMEAKQDEPHACASENTAGDILYSSDKGEEVMEEVKEEKYENSEEVKEREKNEANNEEPVEQKVENEEERHADSLLMEKKDSECIEPMKEDDIKPQDPVKKKAACSRGELKGMAADQELCQCAGDGQKTDCEEVDDELTQQADMEENHITLAIIQEPESESSDEESLYTTTPTSQSSAEDFVVINEMTVYAGNANTTGGTNTERNDQTSDESSVDKTLKEEAGDEEQDDSTPGDTDPTKPLVPDDTDPTRPIKRNEGPDNTQGSALHSTMPAEPLPTSNTDAPSALQDPASFRISLPLVGFSPDNVHVILEGRNLQITASRQARVGEAPYSESVQQQLELPSHVDVMTVRCVYLQDQGFLLITANPHTQHTIPVVLQ